jgi:hypothetical protein
LRFQTTVLTVPLATRNKEFQLSRCCGSTNSPDTYSKGQVFIEHFGILSAAFLIVTRLQRAISEQNEIIVTRLLRRSHRAK